jgi:deuterolysin
MKFLTSVSLLVTLANAVTIGRRDEPLSVKLEMTGNTAVQAVITNSGNEALKIFKTGTFLDSSPIEKAQVFKNGKKITR